MANAALVSLATRQQVLLERLKAGDAKKLEAFLKEAAAAIRNKLAGENLTELSRARAEAQLKAISDDLTAIYANAGRQITSDLKELADYTAGAEVRALESVLIDGVEMTIPPANQVYAAAIARPMTSGKSAVMMESLIRDWSASSVKAVENAIRLGYFSGQTNQQLVQQVIGTKANKYQDGIINATYRNAQAVVRTSVQHVAQVARNEAFAQNADIVNEYEWVSTLDSRTSIQCFPAEIEVLSTGALENVFRANYVGEMFVITTASGKKIEGTPNHPVLTARGFLPIHELNPSDKVICPVLCNMGMVDANKNVCMPTMIGELFDSFSEKPFFDVSSKCASAVDFYGDGRCMNGEVDIVRIDGKLRGDHVSGTSEDIEDKSFGIIHDASSLSAKSTEVLSFLRDRLPEMASQINSMFLESGIDGILATPKLPRDFDWLNSFIEQFDHPDSVSLDVYITLASLKDWHDSMLLEQAGHCGGGCVESTPQFSSGSAFSVHADDVVSIVSKFVDCHVYTIGSSLGFYIANGILVKNCRALDGQTFPVGKGPLPPIHYGCRSSVAPVISNKYIRETLREGATRSAAGGPVSANLSYYEWLKTQPASFQDEAMGPVKAKLLRDGGLSAQRFQELQLGKNFEPLTLAEMERLEPVAFNRAGLEVTDGGVVREKPAD